MSGQLCRDHAAEWLAWLDYELPQRGVGSGGGTLYDSSRAGVRDRLSMRFDWWKETIRTQQALIERACEAHRGALNVLSLFSGAGGLDLGLERAGLTVVGQVEIDKFCCRVLEKHWPGVARHEDVRTAVEWWTGEPVRPRVDVLAGGFPCQPFSPAGRRRGVADERWGWPWMERVVRALRPRYVLVENVVDLVRDGQAFGWLLGDLSALGFDAEWSVLSACALGAPHTRERVFVLAYPAGVGSVEHGRVEHRQGDPERHPHHWSTEPEPHRVADGVPRRMDRNRVLGQAVVPQVGELVGRRLMSMAGVAA